jgi:ABC-type glycerol-3-phosphate transport system substrate-binding protein
MPDFSELNLKLLKYSKTMLVALAVLLAQGCGDKGPDPLRFRFWGDTSEIKIITDLIAECEKANPGVVIKGERKPPNEAYADGLLTEIAAGQAPDVMFMGELNCDKLIAGNAFLALDTFLDKDTELKKSDFYPLVIERFTSKGKLYLLPRDIAPIACIYYNKSLFDKAGLEYPKNDWNWKDFENKAVKLTKRLGDGRAEQLGYGEFSGQVEPYVFSAGGTMVDDFRKPTRITLDSPKALEGIAFRWRLLNQGVTDTFFGRHEHCLVEQDGALRIEEKRTILDMEALRPQGRLSIIV